MGQSVNTLRSRARTLRTKMTPQEVRLWGELRNLNRQGHHFRRQAPVDGFILNFADFRHRLIIEVDGSQHGFEAGAARDRVRDRHFESAGFRVLPFWNVDVDTNMDSVVLTILEALARPPPPQQWGREDLGSSGFSLA